MTTPSSATTTRTEEKAYGYLIAVEKNNTASISVSTDIFRDREEGYMRLGNRVYRIFKDESLLEKSFGLNTFQIQDLLIPSNNAPLETFYAIQPQYLHQASFYPSPHHKPISAKSIHLTITRAPQVDDEDEEGYLIGEEVIKAFRATYSHHYLCRGQKISFKSQEGLLEAQIVNIKKAEDNGRKRSITSHALVEDESVVKLKAPKEAPKTTPRKEALRTTRIVNMPKNTNDASLVECHITAIEDKTAGITDDSILYHPWGVSTARLKKILQSTFTNKIIYPTTIKNSHILFPFSMTITVEKLINPKTRQVIGQISDVAKVIPSIAWNENTQFEFIIKHPKPELIEDRTKGPPPQPIKLVLIEDKANERPADKLFFKINEVYPHELDKRSEDRGRQPCFFIDEIKKALLDHSFFKGAHSNITLYDYYNVPYVLKIEILAGINEPSLVPRQEFKEPLWNVVEETKLQVSPTKNAVVALKRDGKSVDEVVLSVKAQVQDEKSFLREDDILPVLRKLSYTARGENLTIVDNNGQYFLLKVLSHQWRGDGHGDSLAIIDEHTKFTLQPADNVKIVKRKKKYSSDIKKVFHDLGLGGLSDEMLTTLKRLKINFKTHCQEILSVGIEPPRGIILHGIPGTGKSKTAVAIAEFLGADPENIQIVSTPSLLSKYVGETEAKIRKLVEPVKEAYLKNDYGLRIIVLDEFSSLGCARKADNPNWVNTHVDQFLSVIAGIEPLPPNLLFIATTNRIEDMDEAFLRPGRFSIQLKIEYLSLAGRCEVFAVHTRQAQERGILSKEIDWQALAAKCEKFTGAMMKDVVNVALNKWFEHPLKDPDIRRAEEQKLAAMIHSEHNLSEPAALIAARCASALRLKALRVTQADFEKVIEEMKAKSNPPFNLLYV